MTLPESDSFAPELAPEGGDFSSSQDAVRSAIRVVLRAGVAHASEQAPERGLGIDDQVRSLAAGAHMLGIRAEQLIILMKEIWLSLPEARALDTAAPGGPQLSRLITRVLDEFYRPDRAD